MSDILYRIATEEDCYAIAKLKGIIWNTTYQGIYSDEALAGYGEFFVGVNSRNINAIDFYTYMGGKVIDADERQMKIVYTV